jgi:hypothetical protein
MTVRKNIDVISRFPRQPSSRLQIHLSSRAKFYRFICSTIHVSSIVYWFSSHSRRRRRGRSWPAWQSHQVQCQQWESAQSHTSIAGPPSLVLLNSYRPHKNIWEQIENMIGTKA